MARTHVVRVAAVSQCEEQIAIRTESNRSAVVVSRVLAERDDFASRDGIHLVGVRGADLPLGDDVLVVLHGPIGRIVGGSCPDRDELAVVGIEGAESDAARRVEARMERQPEQTTFVVGVRRVHGRRDPGLNVERGSGQQGAVLDHQEQPLLLQDEQAVDVARGADRVVRGTQPGHDGLQIHGDVAPLDVRQRIAWLRPDLRTESQGQGNETGEAGLLPHHGASLL